MKKLLTNIYQSFKTTAWALNHLFNAAPFETISLFLFVIIQGMIPAISLYAVQEIIDWMASASQFPLFFVGLWGSLLLADIMLSPLVAIIRLHLNEKLLVYCNVLLMEKANSIKSLESFENPLFYDEIQFLKNESSRKPLNFVYVLTGFFKDCIALLSVSAVLSILEWWIPLGIFMISLPHAISTLWFEKQEWDQMLFRSPEARKMSWLSSIILDERFAKEVRFFRFGNFLINRYKNLAQTTYQALSKERWKKSGLSILLSSLSVIGNVSLISIILMQAKQGNLKIGNVVIVIQALILTQSQLTGCIANIGMAAPILFFFDKLKKFLESQLCFISNHKTKDIGPSFQEIRFENVSFSYSDGRKALSKVNFSIKQGEKVAIVGENGAGKSTIVKLLLRFYDPQEGAIKIDGIDLRTIDIDSWRSLISGVFQDFGQYHLTVEENIALGDIKASADNISLAAFKGGFTPTLERLPNGLKALLGKEFGGTSLSGGEWQKLAMSRAFVREANLLILDEPTSALDPQSEQEVFKKFSEQSKNKSALLITHRLGSVKMADRILVFKNGNLIEQGTHCSLLDQKGEYASLFNLQADQYSIFKAISNQIS